MTMRPLMTDLSGGRPPASRFGIVLPSVVILVYIANIVLFVSSATFEWYAWILAVGVVLMTYAVIGDVRRARQSGRRW